MVEQRHKCSTCEYMIRTMCETPCCACIHVLQFVRDDRWKEAKKEEQ